MTDPVQRSDALDERLTTTVGIERSIRDLMLASRRNALLIRILAVSLAFDILLSGALGYVAFQARFAVTQATSLEQQQRSACLSGNEARAVNLQLWTYILDLPQQAPRTAAQQQQVDQFRAYIGKTFAPRRC